MEYKLIIPTNEVIDQFNQLWSDSDQCDKRMTIFQGVESVDVSEYLPKGIEKFNKRDEEIKNAFKLNDYIGGFKHLNSYYGTRLKTQKLTERVSEIDVILKDAQNTNNLDEFCHLCKDATKTYAYSFSSKVYNFLYPDKYPIIDSVSSTLLSTYLSYKEIESDKSLWGYYSEYIKSYDKFICAYNIEKSYKRIDIFLWLYGVIITNYWKDICKDIGILEFKGVAYKNK